MCGAASAEEFDDDAADQHCPDRSRHVGPVLPGQTYRDEWTLLLGPQPPYFSVVTYDRAQHEQVDRARFFTIVPAVRDDEDSGGDY